MTADTARTDHMNGYSLGQGTFSERTDKPSRVLVMAVAGEGGEIVLCGRSIVQNCEGGGCEELGQEATTIT